MKKIISLILFLLPSVALAAPAVLDSTSLYCGEPTPARARYFSQGGISTGDTTLVSGVAGKRIRVISWAINCNTAGSFHFEHSNSSDISGVVECSADETVSQYCGPQGCFQTSTGSLLNIETATGTFDVVQLTYIECVQ